MGDPGPFGGGPRGIGPVNGGLMGGGPPIERTRTESERLTSWSFTHET